jgi:hypothetical protein
LMTGTQRRWGACYGSSHVCRAASRRKGESGRLDGGREGGWVGASVALLQSLPPWAPVTAAASIRIV